MASIVSGVSSQQRPCILEVAPYDGNRVLAQEEEERDYLERFPDHFKGFEDIAVLEGEVPVDDDRLPVPPPEAADPEDAVASAAQASSAAASALLHGELLNELVALHARCAKIEAIAIIF